MNAHKPIYISIDKAMSDAYAIEICRASGKRLVSSAVQREGELQDAIMTLALGSGCFTTEEIDTINGQLDRKRYSINVWLDELGHG